MVEAGSVNLFDNCVLLSLTVHVIGNAAKGELDQVETEADKSQLRLTKKLLDCEEYDNLIDIANRIRNEVKGRCLGGASVNVKTRKGKTYQVGRGLQGLIKSGCYLVPLDLITKIQDLLDSLSPEFELRVAKLCEVYEDRKEQQRARLKDQFNDRDYHSVERVKKACYVDYKYLSVGVPESLKGIRSDIFEKEQTKAQAAWSEATEEIKLVLRASMKSLVDHMVDRLKCGDDGQKKRFHTSMISKMKEFLVDFSGKNIVDDDELANLVDKARGILVGKTADALRTDSDLRENVLKRMGEVKEQLDNMLEDVPSRAILLEV